MKIWIDADGCPVVQSTIRIAKRLGIPVMVVKNHAVKIESDYAQVITVDLTSDAVDYYIANHLKPMDLVITQDNGLAAMVLAKQGVCMNQNGKIIDASNIDFILDARHLGRVARQQKQRGPKHKKRTLEDDLAFEKALINRLENEAMI